MSEIVQYVINPHSHNSINVKLYINGDYKWPAEVTWFNAGNPVMIWLDVERTISLINQHHQQGDDILTYDNTTLEAWYTGEDVGAVV